MESGGTGVEIPEPADDQLADVALPGRGVNVDDRGVAAWLVGEHDVRGAIGSVVVNREPVCDRVAFEHDRAERLLGDRQIGARVGRDDRIWGRRTWGTRRRGAGGGGGGMGLAWKRSV